MWGVTWVNIRMMLADAPRYDYDSDNIANSKGSSKKHLSDEDWLNDFAGA